MKELRTPINGGTASLEEVAAAWKSRDRSNTQWDNSESNRYGVELAKRIMTEEEKLGPAKPDPRNLHN